MPWIYLSHPLNPETPAYGGRESLEVAPLSRIAKGESSNSSRWTLSNHLGTHLESSFHFFDQGTRIDQFGPSDWLFSHPLLIDCPAGESQLIHPEDLERALSSRDFDLLLIRTGFEKRRGTRDYWEKNPSLAPDAGRWIRSNLPELRAVGLDTISFSGWQNRDSGRELHRILLKPDPAGRSLVLIEDMALESAAARLREVWALPLRVTGADGAPCTIVGRTD